jgi:hypothetical protein
MTNPDPSPTQVEISANALTFVVPAATTAVWCSGADE